MLSRRLNTDPSYQPVNQSDPMLDGSGDRVDDLEKFQPQETNSPPGSGTRCSARCVLNWFKELSLLRKVMLFLGLLLAFQIGYDYFDGEEYFLFMYKGHPYNLRELAVTWDSEMCFDEEYGDLSEVVDHTYVMSYRPLLKRRAQLYEQLKSIGMHRNLTFQCQWDRHKVVEERDLFEKLYFKGAKDMRPGGKIRLADTGPHEAPAYLSTTWRDEPITDVKLAAVANGMGHLTVIRDMVEKGYKNALFLEDDITPVRHFRQRFLATARQLPKDYHIAFVGTCLRRHAPKPRALNIAGNIYWMLQHRCANGYMLSLEGAKNVLATLPLERGQMNIDPLLENSMRENFNTYWFQPPLVYERSKVKYPWQAGARKGGWHEAVFGFMYDQGVEATEESMKVIDC